MGMTEHVTSTTPAWTGHKKGTDSGRQQRQERLRKMKGLMMSTTVDSLFVDDSFPPDKSSLTYVYSGDDQYERMIFRRPPELSSGAQLYGIGGVCNIDLSWEKWTAGHWFRCALAVVSTDRRYMERLIPGYGHFGQDFGHGYRGSFRFRLWRFGEWTDVLVDDFLPVLNGCLAYCPPLGSRPEFWGPLVEKAYAKCHKAYEAIESGNCLDAIADLCGAICEHYSTSYPLYHVIYKSCANRSLIVCWRNSRSYRQGEFKSQRRMYTPSGGCSLDSQDSEDRAASPADSQLYIVTAVTQFPLRDGTRLYILRLKNPYLNFTLWRGEFAIGNDLSWSRVEPAFLKTYRPKECRDSNEFWLTYVDFCQHFDDVIVCSSTEPSSTVHVDSERHFPDDSGLNVEATSPGANGCANELPRFKSDEQSAFESGCRKEKDHCAAHEPIGCKDGEQTTPETIGGGGGDQIFITLSDLPRRKSAASYDVKPRENRRAMKVDAVEKYKPEVDAADGHTFSNAEKKAAVGSSNAQKAKTNREVSAKMKDDVFLVRSPMSFPAKSFDSATSTAPVCRQNSGASSGRGSNHSCYNLFAAAGTVPRGTRAFYGNYEHAASVASDLSALSNLSNHSSRAGSMSDISIKVNGAPDKRKAAPRLGGTPLSGSNTTVNSIQGHMFEARMDYFKPKGRWAEIAHCSGKWTKETSGGPRHDMNRHSNNPRIPFTIAKPDAVDAITPPSVQGKSHVIVSLLQDYRERAWASNSLLMVVGFCIYKSKNTEKDEKRHLSKLLLVADVTSQSESRDVTARFDLDPGCYFLVPYTMEAGHEGRFLVSVLGENERVSNKTGCIIS